MSGELVTVTPAGEISGVPNQQAVGKIKDPFIVDLETVADIARRTGILAGLNFTNTTTGSLGTINPDWPVNRYFNEAAYYEPIKTGRIPFLEEVIRENDQALFGLKPSDLIDEFKRRGALMMAGVSTLLRVGTDPVLQYESSYIPGQRLMLCLPTTIVGVQYLFTAEKV